MFQRADDPSGRTDTLLHFWQVRVWRRGGGGKETSGRPRRLPKRPPKPSVRCPGVQVDDMYDFDNVGFSKTVGTIKVPLVAEMEAGVWCDACS